MYMLNGEMKWKVLPPMPKPDSHIECAWVLVNNSIIITGGTTEKHPVTKRMILVGEVFRFDLDSLVINLPCSLGKKNKKISYCIWRYIFVMIFVETLKLVIRIIDNFLFLMFFNLCIIISSCYEY